MYEDSRNIDAIRTRHAVLTIIAGDILQTNDALSDIRIKRAHTLLLQRHQRTIAEQIVFQMLHIGHTTKHGEHAFIRTCIAESPRSHTLRGVELLHLIHQILWQISQATTQKGLHDDSRNATFLEFLIKIAGIDVTIAHLISEVPVQIVKLNLNKIPVILIVQGQHLVEHTLHSVE